MNDASSFDPEESPERRRLRDHARDYERVAD